MNYILKKIIIGVSIGFILMTIKSCEVHAAAKYMSNFDTKVASMSFDACQKNGSDVLCIDGFSKDLTINNNYQVFYPNTNQIITLKHLSLSLVYNNSDFQILRYGNLTSPIFQIFNNNSNTGYDNNKLRVNNFLSYVKITTQDNVVCEIFDNVGASISTSYSPYAVLPYFEVPTECRSKYLKQIDLIFQSGYNYTGNDSIFSPIDFTSGMSVANYVNNNKNNTYLLSWGLDNKTLNHNLAIAENMNNLQLYFGNSPYSNNTSLNTYTIESAQIQENLAALDKEIFIASSFIGSDTYDTEESDKFTSSFSNTISSASNQLNSVGFTSFLNALVVEPISLLNQSASTNFYDSNHHLTGSLCFHSFQQGGTNYGWIPIPFKDTGDYTKDYFQMPCMTTSIYSNIHSNKQHSHNDSITGYTEISTSSSFTSVGFISIWLLIQHAVLYVWLTITFVNIVKYCIDTKDSEIEVMDL